MAEFMDLPVEVKRMIFQYLQAITSGPRYLIKPKNLDGQTPEEIACEEFSLRDPHNFIVSPRDLDTGSLKGRRKRGNHVYQWSPGYDFRLCWELIDPGPFYLASTCRQLFSIYLSSSIANNLVLEVPVLSSVAHAMIWDPDNPLDKRRDGLSKRLKRVQEGRRGIPLTRFMLDHHPDNLSSYTYNLWKDILEVVNEVFGDELLVVTICSGEGVDKKFRELAPERIRYLEAFENPLLMERTIANNHRQTEIKELPQQKELSKLPRPARQRSGRIPKQGSSPVPRNGGPPLSLHLYFGASHNDAKTLLNKAIEAFGMRTVKSLCLYIDCSHGTYPQLLNKPLSALTSPTSRISTTLSELTLDCSMSIKVVTDLLSKLPNLKRLDLEMLAVLSDAPPWNEESAKMLTWFREKCLDKEGRVREWYGRITCDEEFQGKKDANILPMPFFLILPLPRSAPEWDALRLDRSKR